VKRLWDKGEPLDERILRYTAGEDHLLDARLVPYDVRRRSRTPRMLAAEAAVGARLRSDLHGLEALAESHAAGEWSISWRTRTATPRWSVA
jgi:argininosuccinate lyase